MDKLLPILLLLGAFLVWNTEANAIIYDEGCPAAAAISPCVCTNVDLSLNLDCSDVTGDVELAQVFQVDFPFKQIGNFTILRLPSQPRVTIEIISKDTFGEVYFENVIISHTTLKIMQGDPFEKSRNSLVTMAITDNEINSFPFSYLPLYKNLKDLRLFNNKLGRLSDVHSDSLLYLQVSYNHGLEYDNEVFYNVSNLKYLGINGLGLTNIAPYTFRYLSSLEYLDLSENDIQSVWRGSLWFQSPNLDVVVLDYNNMQTIEAEAIKYCLPNVDPNICESSPDAKAPAFLLTSNQLMDIPQEVWAESFERSRGKVDYYAFDVNPVNCTCDIAWLVIDRGYQQQVSDGSTCDNNDMSIPHLPSGIFTEQCTRFD